MFFEDSKTKGKPSTKIELSYGQEIMYKTDMTSYQNIEEIVHSFLTLFEMAGTIKDYRIMAKELNLDQRRAEKKGLPLKKEMQISDLSFLKMLIKCNQDECLKLNLEPLDHLSSVYLPFTPLRAPKFTRDSALTKEEIAQLKQISQVNTRTVPKPSSISKPLRAPVAPSKKKADVTMEDTEGQPQSSELLNSFNNILS